MRTKVEAIKDVQEKWRIAELALGRMEDQFHSPMGLYQIEPVINAYKQARAALQQIAELPAEEREAILRESVPGCPTLENRSRQDWAKEMHPHVSAVKRNLEKALAKAEATRKVGRPKVFFSWQDDCPEQKRLLMKCLSEAAEKCEADFDHDTDRSPGAAPITETILKKIEEADVFIGDVSPYNQTGAERLPNANVMMEVGYAAHAFKKDWGRIILLTNTEVGRPEALPFNIRHLRISTFRRNETEAQLCAKFQHFIATGLKAARGTEENDKKGYLPRPEMGTRGCFFEPGTMIVQGKQMTTGGLAFLRLYPETEVEPIRNELGAERLASPLLKPMGRVEDIRGYRTERNLFGAVSYETDSSAPELGAITQLFLTKELWGINGKWLNKGYLEARLKAARDQGFPSFDRPFIASTAVEQTFIEALTNYLAFAKQGLQLPLPLKIKTGVAGIEGMQIGTEKGITGQALQDNVVWEGQITAYEIAAEELLRPFFELLWENCGLTRKG